MSGFWGLLVLIAVAILWKRTNDIRDNATDTGLRLDQLTIQVNRLAEAQLKLHVKPEVMKTLLPEDVPGTDMPPEAASQSDIPMVPPPTAIPPASPLPPSQAVWQTPSSSVHLSSPPDVLWSDEVPQTPKPTPSAAPNTAPAAAKPYIYKAKDTNEAKNAGFEFQFGKKLPVWIGGVCLALAGFYLVKYSIEKNLLTNEVRIFLGTAFGFALAFAGRYIRSRQPQMADGTRIAQALTGAAICDLYATAYAAVSVWHVISPMAGFVCLAAVTVFAVILSLRHGMPIAIMGLIGGFLTPMMVSTDHPNAVTLFVYLYFLVAGFFALVRSQGWLILAIPVTLLGLFWVPVWIFGGHFNPDDGICLGLFILAVCATIGAQVREKPDMDAATIKAVNATGAVATTVGCLLMALVMERSDFGIFEWGIYGLLGLGGMVMTYFKPQQYRYLPILSMGISIVMLALWRHDESPLYATVLTAFSALYIACSLFFYQAQRSFLWGGTLAAAVLGFYGLGYLTIGEHAYALLNIAETANAHFWSALAILAAIFFAGMTGGAFRNPLDNAELRDRLLALFCLMTTGFISIALLIEVHEDFLPVAFAGEILAAAWVYERLGIFALRRIIGTLFAAFVVLLAPQVLLLFAVAVHSLFGLGGESFGNLSLAADPFFQLGMPLVMLGLASYIIRLRGDGKIVETLELACVGLGGLLAYYAARRAFHVPADVLFHKAGFFERGVITNVFFAAAFLAVYTGRRFARRALLWGGTALFSIALFRVFYFDVLVYNPLFNSTNVGAVFLLNSLAISYGLPLFWLWVEDQPQMRVMAPVPGLKGAASLLLIFLLVTLNVRQLFHGTDLTVGPTENAEIYAYSAAWLLLGAGLLFVGTLKKRKELRIASLVLLILTVGKVFLYDAGALEGLYRVASFLGLGLSLLALSWFYSRFVFIKKDVE